jgi:signal transduction histidine kinase
MSKRLIFPMFALMLSLHGYSQGITDSLETRLKTWLKETERVSILSELCWQFRRVDQTKALNYGKQAVILARESTDKPGLSKSLNDLSIIYMDRTELDTAIILLNQALEIRKELKDSIGEAAVYNKLGIIYQNKQDLASALSNALKALDLFEKMNMQPHVRTTMNNIGIIHFNLHNYDKSIAIHSELLKLRTEAGDDYGIGQTMVNIGNVRCGKGDSLMGINYYQQASSIFRRLDKKEELGVVLINLAAHQNIRGQYSEARKNLEEGIAIRRASNNPKEICSALILLGELNVATKQYKQARENLSEALKISRQYQLPVESVCYEKLAVMYRGLKNADSVYHYFFKFAEMSTATYDANLKSEVAELQTKYETAKKEQSIISLSHQNTVQQLSLFRQRLYFGGGALVLLLSGVFAWQYQRTKRFKEKIRHELKLKEEQDRAARAVIETELNERRRIAAELHDGVIQTFAAAKLNLSGIHSSVNFSNPAQEKVYHNSMSLIEEGCTELRTISHTMMPEVLLKKGLPEALRELVNRIDRSIIVMHLSIYGLDQRLDSSIETSVYRIIQECISNTLKHSGAARMDIQLNIDGSNLDVTIEDNGKGFDTSRMDQAEGIGLQNIRSRINLLSGHFEVDSKPGSGTLFTITLPLKVVFSNSAAIERSLS